MALLEVTSIYRLMHVDLFTSRMLNGDIFDFGERTELYWTAERGQEIMGKVGLMLSGCGAILSTCTKRHTQILFLLLFMWKIKLKAFTCNMTS